MSAPATTLPHLEPAAAAIRVRGGLINRSFLVDKQAPTRSTQRQEPGDDPDQAQRSDHDDRELKALGLVNRHDLHVSLRKGLVRVLVLIDPAVVEKAQETVEEVKAQELAITMRNDGVVVVALENI